MHCVGLWTGGLFKQSVQIQSDTYVWVHPLFQGFMCEERGDTTSLARGRNVAVSNFRENTYTDHHGGSSRFIIKKLK